MLTDHANYDQFGDVAESELVRPGSPDPNGVGALRRIKIRPLTFEEEITRFESPTRMDYVIRDINAPLEHEGGTITFEGSGNSTHVTWESTFGVTIPVIGGALNPLAVAAVKRGFKRMLRDTGTRLAKP